MRGLQKQKLLTGALLLALSTLALMPSGCRARPAVNDEEATKPPTTPAAAKSRPPMDLEICSSLQEMDAVARGREAALGGLPEIRYSRIEAGSARADARMLALLNASEDMADLTLHCYGFAVSGTLTDAGQTRVAGTQQGSFDVRHEHQLLVVRKPDYGLATVCSGCVGKMTCSRGMNETGVVTMPQGADTPWLSVEGPCYAPISHVASPKKLSWSLERKASTTARLSPRRKDGPWPG